MVGTYRMVWATIGKLVTQGLHFAASSFYSFLRHDEKSQFV